MRVLNADDMNALARDLRGEIAAVAYNYAGDSDEMRECLAHMISACEMFNRIVTNVEMRAVLAIEEEMYNEL